MAGGKGAVEGSGLAAGEKALAGSSELAAVTQAVGSEGKEIEKPESSASDGVAAMMGRLRLTAKESKTFVLDGNMDMAVGCPEWAIVGKFLAPNTLHIEMIKAVLCPAWGNPKGMTVRH
jgi:hypothetical protein